MNNQPGTTPQPNHSVILPSPCTAVAQSTTLGSVLARVICQQRRFSDGITGKYFLAGIGVWDSTHEINPWSHGKVIKPVGKEFVIENLGVSTPARYIVPSEFFSTIKCRFFDTREEMEAALETAPRCVCLGDYVFAQLGMQPIGESVPAHVGAAV